MNKQGFGLISILIGAAVIAILAVSGLYFSNNTNQILRSENGANNIIKKAKDVKNKLEENSNNIVDYLD